MRTRIQKWGNSLAVRIPKSFAAEVGIDHDSDVELTLVEGKLVIIPMPPQPLTLDMLLAGVTDENIHQELDSGMPVGNEMW